MVPEAELRDDGAGLVPASSGWFVVNAREARWLHRPGRGDALPLTGCDEFEAETFFPMLGMSMQVFPPSEPNGTYHWETEQEDFLVLAGEALAIVEGQERPLSSGTSYTAHPRPDTCSLALATSRVSSSLRRRGSSRKTGRGAFTAPMRSQLGTTQARPRTPKMANSRTAGSPPSRMSRYRDGFCG